MDSDIWGFVEKSGFCGGLDLKRVLALLICLLLTISMTSCTLSEDGGSSLPTVTAPESEISDSSEMIYSSEERESSEVSSAESEQSSVSKEDDTFEQSSDASSKKSSSKEESSSKESSSKEQSSRKESSSSKEQSSSSEQKVSSAAPSSSKPVSSDNLSEESSSESGVKPEIKPIKAENYYCYSRLSPIQKKAYNSIVAAADTMPNGFIELGDADELTQSDVYLAAITVKTDHPEIFWLPYAWYIGETHNDKLAILFVNDVETSVGDSIESITATYVIERAKKQKMQQELRAAVEKIKSKITATDPYEIELQLHDILAKKITYLKGGNISPLAYTAYGALVEGKAVCEGYSRAFQLLLYEFGINSTLASGYAGLEHMWNLVQIGGAWYHVDITWDDQQSETNHLYFNLTDQSISRDHIINTDYKNLTDHEVISGEPFNYSLPVCNSTAANYFEKTGLMLPRDTEKLISGIKSGNIKQVEVIGWSDQIKTALKKAGLNVTFIFKDNWAIITAKK